MGFGKQPNRQLPSGEYARTTRRGNNVRTWEPATTRDRGSSRPGISKYLSTQIAGTEFVCQDLNVIVSAGFTPPGGTVQQSQSGRVVTLVGVSQGNIYTTTPGGTAWTAATNNSGETPPLNYSGIVFSAANNQQLFFVDGINYIVYDPSTNIAVTWAATAGTLPVDSDGNYARLICTWRGRTVVSGLLNDPQNWFMSKLGDAYNWDYGSVVNSTTRAVAGNNSSLGFIGDVVTSLIPYSDDVLIFGGDHSIYMMSGDPMGGGQIDLVSDAIGMAWGMPWCKDPYGVVYFFSNRTGIYTLVPGQAPVRISQAIEQLLFGVDTGANAIRLMWNDRFQGLHVFITSLDAPIATTHLFYETRSGAWWTDRFAKPAFDPLCCVVLDGNDPDDRVPLMGCWDGYVRALDALATDDDGFPISSEVVIGPILTPNLDEMTIKDLQAIIGESSGTVNFQIYAGRTAELALRNAPVFSSSWKAGRNLTKGMRASGHALYLRISSTDQWAMEQIRARITTRGKVRMRGH